MFYNRRSVREGGLQQEMVHKESDSAVPALAGGDSHPLPLGMNSNKEYPEPRWDNI